ncbi:RNA polymerase factor sigma-54 [Sulfitobacter sp. 916]|uniref:RNA polymerase factor sigma-54 n=1 Tax=Sulfitobacter sp. 916 TaxID=3368559 RepID=UPI0037463F60
MQLQAVQGLSQTQSLKITAQAIQSIRILQLGSQDLYDLLREEAESNPLLDVRFPDPYTRSYSSGEFNHASKLSGRPPASQGGMPPKDLPAIADTHAYHVSLREHLHQQAAIAIGPVQDRKIALEIIESIEPDGYLRRLTAEIAAFLKTEEKHVLRVLGKIQEFAPCGVGARDLAECLRLQLAERGKLTPQTSRLLENLPLLAKYEIDKLARICESDRASVIDMMNDLKRLSPAPGRQFDSSPTPLAMPDIIVDHDPSGDFRVELNNDLLPRALVDREYYALIRGQAQTRSDRKFIADCMQNATWLTKNLDRRAQTILRVAGEIVIRQRDYFNHGADHLKPLGLRDIAESVGVHQSTVSRAIANKYILSPRGLTSLKFFFSEAIPASGSGAQISGEAVRSKIRRLVDAEIAGAVLSDDSIVEELSRNGIDIARRTVAKYRKKLQIPSSATRKRIKRSQTATTA